MDNIFSNTDDIAIFASYDTNKLIELCVLIYDKCGRNNTCYLYKLFSKFCQETFGIELTDDIIMSDKLIAYKNIHIYLHRMVRAMIHRCYWSKIYESDKQEYYKNIIHMPILFIEFLQK